MTSTRPPRCAASVPIGAFIQHRCHCPALLDGYCVRHNPAKRLAVLLRKQGVLTIQIAEVTLQMNGIKLAQLEAK